MGTLFLKRMLLLTAAAFGLAAVAPAFAQSACLLNNDSKLCASFDSVVPADQVQPSAAGGTPTYIEYRATLKNVSQTSTRYVQFALATTPDANFVEFTSSMAGCTVSGADVSCQFDKLNTGSTISVRALVEVPALSTPAVVLGEERCDPALQLALGERVSRGGLPSLCRVVGLLAVVQCRQQHRAESAPLMGVLDQERDLGVVGVGVPVVAADGDQPLDGSPLSGSQMGDVRCKLDRSGPLQDLGEVALLVSGGLADRDLETRVREIGRADVGSPLARVRQRGSSQARI